jgi:hypothetical protein
MKKPRSIAPIIGAILLLLPVLYVGSYLALVTPESRIVIHRTKLPDGSTEVTSDIESYRVGGVAWIFWPLEQIDRRVRPGAWRDLLEP